MTLSPWGTGPWGTSAWGGDPATVALANVFARGATTVRVTLTSSPMANSGLNAGDALNPNTWAVTNLATGQVLPVIDVEVVSSPLVYDLSLLYPLGDALTEHELNAASLLSASGVPCFPPNQYGFLGVLASRQTTQEAFPYLRAPTQDLANPIVPASQNQIPNTFQYAPGGDYQNVSGVELTKKMILRRWTTSPGAFFHLPTFGSGLQPKQIIRTPDVATLTKSLEQQALLEPDVASCTVSVVIDRGDNVLYVIGNAISTAGAAVTVKAAAGSATGVQF